MELELTQFQIKLVTIIIPVIGLILFLIVSYFLREFVVSLFKRPQDKNVKIVIKNKWVEVEKLIAMNNENGYKLAVLEADKLFDLALKAMYLPGENMGQRLKVLVARNQNTSSVWQSHILRNKIAHETHYIVKKNEATRAIVEFKRVLKMLGFL